MQGGFLGEVVVKWGVVFAYGDNPHEVAAQLRAWYSPTAIIPMKLLRNFERGIRLRR